MFNGAMDRYDFKLIGKKEMVIPYNAYRFQYDQPDSAPAVPARAAGRNLP